MVKKYFSSRNEKGEKLERERESEGGKGGKEGRRERGGRREGGGREGGGRRGTEYKQIGYLLPFSLASREEERRSSLMPSLRLMCPLHTAEAFPLSP